MTIVPKSEDLDGKDQNGNSYKVLVTDDESPARKMIAQILRSSGYTICGEAANGKEALEIFKKEEPDLVILDIHMPIMGGKETLTKMLEIIPDALIVILSFENQREMITEFIQAGAKDYLLKPVNRQKLLVKLHKIRRDKVRHPL